MSFKAIIGVRVATRSNHLSNTKGRQILAALRCLADRVVKVLWSSIASLLDDADGIHAHQGSA